MALVMGRLGKRGIIWTITFVIICTAVYVMDIYSGFYIIDNYSFVPSLAFDEPWRFITSMFLHASPEHLIFNMFALFMFGSYLESIVGGRRFVTIYFLAGIAGNLAYWGMAFLFFSNIPAVGASGAIYGVMGMLAFMRPKLIVYAFGFPMPMIIAAAMWTLIELLGLFVPGAIAHEAHLAGIIVGAIYGRYLKNRQSRVRFFWE